MTVRNSGIPRGEETAALFIAFHSVRHCEVYSRENCAIVTINLTMFRRNARYNLYFSQRIRRRKKVTAAVERVMYNVSSKVRKRNHNPFRRYYGLKILCQEAATLQLCDNVIEPLRGETFYIAFVSGF